MKQSFCGGLILFAVAVSGWGQGLGPYTIQPFAGVPHAMGDGAAATSAILWAPFGVTTDGAGNLLITDTSDNSLRRVSGSGIITTVSSQLKFPWRAAVSSTGDIYVADTDDNRILKISGTNVTTFAGTGVQGNDGDGGLANAATINAPHDVAVSSSGTVYILDSGNNRIRKVTPDGKIAAFAGTGAFGHRGDGDAAINAWFSFPEAIALDRSGDLFIADTYNQRIRVVTPDGFINTVAGLGLAGFTGDNIAASQTALNYPAGIAVDAGGTLYIADSGNHEIRKVSNPLSPAALITAVAGTGAPGFSGDGGSAVAATLYDPMGVSVDSLGDVLIADSGNNRIRSVSPQGTITTVAGSDRGSGDGGPAVSARLFEPSGIVVDGTGTVYVADSNNNRIRRITPDGTISTFLSGLSNPNGLALDKSGALYVADTNHSVIWKVAGGSVAAVVGDPTHAGNAGDEGPASGAQLLHPTAVAFDSFGNMFIADSGNNRVRVVGSNGNIHNYAGEPKQGLPGFAGDGGPATSALLSYPRGLAVDSQGNLYIADFFNDRIRKVQAGSQIITTVAGTGTRGGVGDGVPGTQAQLALPAGIAFDVKGNLLIADTLNNRIRILSASGVLSTIAGSTGPGDSGDGGPALSAMLASPRDVVADMLGNVYFTDQDNNRVRKLTPGLVTVTGIGNSLSGLPGTVAPGERVNIYGFQMGPSVGVSQDPTNGIATNLAGTQVLFDGMPAPLLYVSASQIDAIVPYEIAGQTLTNVVVSVQGNNSTVFPVPVKDASPGILTTIYNQDGSINSPTNPANRGDTIYFYATGEGQTSPPGVTGQVIGDTASTPVLQVTVQIGNQPANLIFAGEPSQSIGLLQVNAQVPDTVTPGPNVPLVLVVGTFGAQPGVTIAVQ
ncbi:MAG TPA: hypothetical protein VKU01_36800 [Bryobacteraceae bacterium]|nr:hypothetical protein [Bryobacteraceae bacterium]